LSKEQREKEKDRQIYAKEIISITKSESTRERTNQTRGSWGNGFGTKTEDRGEIVSALSPRMAQK